MQALVLYCGHQQLREGTLTAGGLVAFILYQTNAGSCVQALAYSYGDLLSNAVAACKVFDYVGERGGQLSAGQKQRIAIARALVRRPTILILDEATSALDGDSDAMLQQWVRNGGDRTVLLITHQPRMLEKADRVVVLEHGTVAEMGTPAELRTRGGPYSRLLQH